MNRDDKEQLEYLKKWSKEQYEKNISRDNKKLTIRMHFARSKTFFRLGFKYLFSCIREIFKPI